MLFNTLDFVLFLPIVIVLYFLTPHKYRWALLLVASYYFYMCWKLEYIFLIIASTLVDYFSGIKMSRLANKKSRLPFLILSICTNLGLLFAFKYFNFFSDTANSVFYKIDLSARIPMIDVLLPVGISFYTFQTLSYSIDVFNGMQKAEKHLGYFALYVSFFPQLVAGPIERFSRLTPQLKAKHTFQYKNLVNGLRLIVYGLFIKMVIADNISVFVDEVYANPINYSSFDILISMFLYSFQIYCDFYGYSTIAIGSALIMGIRIMDNFKSPYLAKNIAEFWQRWHISLSTWFRDYLYYPLGGNRVAKFRWILNILVVFMVSGLWHGANWTFIIWGSIFGIIYLAEKLINKVFRIERNHKAFSPGHILLSLKTFVLVTLIWVFFRSQDMDAVRTMFSSISNNLHVAESKLSIPGTTWLFLLLFIVSDLFLYNKRFDSWLDRFPLVPRWGIYALLVFLIITFSGVQNFPFIYFQF